MAVLPVERLQRLIGQAGKGGMGHIDEMAVLILAVLAGQAAAAQLGVEIPEALVFAVGIVSIPEIELQGVVVILAEIHQCVHFLIGHRVLGDDRAVPVHHAGPVVGDGVVEPDAAQLLLIDCAVAAACAQHKFSACSLHLFHGLDHRRAGAGLTKGNKGIVEIACQKFILHRCSYFSILTLSGRFASSSPKGRAFDIIGNFPMTVKTSHFGGGGIAQAMTERVSQFIVLILSSITQNAAPGYPETAF